MAEDVEYTDEEPLDSDKLQEDASEYISNENCEEDIFEDSEASDEDEESLTDEELDQVADAGIAVIRDILQHFDSQGAEINEYEGDDGEIILDIVGGDLGILIGRRGHTLEAAQTLVSAITHRVIGFRYPISVDVESYKYRQRQKIESLALSAASRADRQNRPVSLRPMTPYERRIVHMALRDDGRVETHSEGVDPNRHVIVSPV